MVEWGPHEWHKEVLYEFRGGQELQERYGWVRPWKMSKNQIKEDVMKVFLCSEGRNPLELAQHSSWLIVLIGSWLPTRLCSDSDTCIDMFLNLSDYNDLSFSDHCNLARAGIELGWCLEEWIIFFNPSFTLSLNPIPTWNLIVVLPLLSEWPSDCIWYSRPFTLWSQPSL